MQQNFYDKQKIRWFLIPGMSNRTSMGGFPCTTSAAHAMANGMQLRPPSCFSDKRSDNVSFPLVASLKF